MFFNRKLRDAILDLTQQLRKVRHSMTAATEHLQAAANRVVAACEALIASNKDLAQQLRDANTANDPAIEAVAASLDAEAAKAEGSLVVPPAEPTA